MLVIDLNQENIRQAKKIKKKYLVKIINYLIVLNPINNSSKQEEGEAYSYLIRLNN
jgi:hypothetical protein